MCFRRSVQGSAICRWRSSPPPRSCCGCFCRRPSRTSMRMSSDPLMAAASRTSGRRISCDARHRQYPRMLIASSSWPPVTNNGRRRDHASSDSRHVSRALGQLRLSNKGQIMKVAIKAMLLAAAICACSTEAFAYTIRGTIPAGRRLVVIHLRTPLPPGIIRFSFYAPPVNAHVPMPLLSVSARQRIPVGYPPTTPSRSPPAKPGPAASTQPCCGPIFSSSARAREWPFRTL